MQTSKKTKKPAHLLKMVHQKNTPTPHNHMNLLTQHCTTTKEMNGHQWEQLPTKDLLEKYLTKYDTNIDLYLIPILYPNIDKWIANKKIDNELSNKFWTNENIIDSQKPCLLKLRHGQYMENAMKPLFLGREVFPSITCPIFNSPNPNTWLHVLLMCK